MNKARCLHGCADRRGELVRSGVKVAIAGPPNVGKSSILNYLAGRKAAIVSATPGTTRDAIEVSMDIGGYKVCHRLPWGQEGGGLSLHSRGTGVEGTECQY